jgi:hypothetical protein
MSMHLASPNAFIGEMIRRFRVPKPLTKRRAAPTLPWLADQSGE